VVVQRAQLSATTNLQLKIPSAANGNGYFIFAK
jgi:hypothetical protein